MSAGPPPGRSDLNPEIVTQGAGGASMVAGGTVDWGAEVHVHVFVWFDNTASGGVETFDRKHLSAYLRAGLESCGLEDEIGVTGKIFNTPFTKRRECRWASLDDYLGNARRVKQLDIYSSLDRSARISRMACFGRAGTSSGLRTPEGNYGTHERSEWGAGEWDFDDPQWPRGVDYNPQPGGYNFYYWQRWHNIAHTDLTRPWRCDTAGQQLRFFFQRAGFGVFDEWGLDNSCGKLPGSCFQKCGTYVKGDESAPGVYHCWCDSNCHQYGDCCWDKESQCGGS
jgi:hypothetical protein